MAISGRRRILGVTAVILLSACAGGVKNMAAATKTTLSKAELDRLLASLEQDKLQFFAEPVHIRWWVRGGEPGAGSDAVTIVSSGANIQATYTRARFHADYDPPMLAEDFIASLTADQAAEIVRAVFGSPVFSERLAEEAKPNMADIQKENWEFSRGGVQLVKTLYEPFPASLARPRAMFQKLMESLAKNGEHVVKSTKAPGKD